MVLNNQGPDAFEPKLYGKSIVIERQITATGKHGLSSYAFKSAKGKGIFCSSLACFVLVPRSSSSRFVFPCVLFVASVISKKRSDLDKILEHFNIQVCCRYRMAQTETGGRVMFLFSFLHYFEMMLFVAYFQPSNPCAIMNQDVSREFLQSKKSEDKYRFFFRATQLETMYNDLIKSEVCARFSRLTQKKVS